MSQKNFRVKNGLAVGNVTIDATSDSIANVVDITANGNIDFSTATSVDLGTSNGIHITDGFPGQVLQSAGNGNVGWLGFTAEVGMTSVVDYFTGDDTTATYTLTTTPINQAFTTVVIDGVTQLKESYSLSNNEITLGGILPQDARLEVTTLNGSNAVTATYNTLQNGNSSIIVNANGNIDFSTTQFTNLGNVANISIAGGTSNTVLTTDGAGNLRWTDMAYDDANYANFAGEANLANTATHANSATIADTANSVAAANITGTVSFATNSTTADVANSVAAANITGTVANANYSAYSGQSNTANSATVSATANTALSVSGSNVSGQVSSAALATYATTANNVAGGNVTGTVANASFATTAGTAQSVSGSNVVGEVANATHSTYAGTAYSVSGANVSGTVTSATVASSANSVAAANITGTVSFATNSTNANTANVANSATVAASANSVALANVSGIGNIASLNLDGNALNVLAGNGAWINITAHDDANYANFAGEVTSSAQPNITSVGNLTALTVDGTVQAQQIIPTVDNTYTLGNANYRWSNLWLGPGTIYITDSANAANTAELTVYDGVLQVNGATGLQANLIAGNTTLTMAPNANIAMSISGTSNVLVVANDGITVQGNVQATYFKGDGSLLTGIAPTVQVYEFANIASGVSTYLTAQWLADYTPNALATTSVTVSTTPTIIQSFITEAGYPNITVLPVGIISIGAHITKASGNKIYQIYAELYKRTSGGTETLLKTTDVGDPTQDNDLTSFVLTADISTPITLNATDRIVTKIYGYVNSGTASLTLSFDDSTNTGLQLPALPASASQFIPYSGATANVDLGAKTITADKFIGSGANLTSIAGANVTGTVTNATYATTAGTAATVTTNAQPNITSVGTLTALTSNGNVNFTGSNVSLGNVANLRITGSSANQFLRANGSNSFTFEDFKMYSELHIDPINGDDANEGSYQYPIKTMAQANSMLNGTISIVYLHQGTYTDNVTITANNLDIVGVSDAGGGIIDYTGNFTLNQTTSSVRVQGISFANLTVATTNAVTYLDSVSVSGTFTKSGNQYVQIRSSRMQGTAVNITGGGQTTFTSPLLTNLTVNNASATTTIQSAVNLTTVNVAAGTLLLRDSIVFSNANANSAITSSAGSVTYVYNTNIVSPAGTVGRVSLAGYWSINQSQYDYANSTSNALLNLQTTSYSDLISVGTLAAVSLSGNLSGNVTGSKFTNGNSNVTMTTNGNITMYVAGNSTARLTATSTGANIAGTANITGNTAIGGNLTTVGTVTSSGNVNGTGFLVGNGAVSNVALGFMPTAGTAAEMAIRDYSTVTTTMYFDAGMGGNSANSQFRFRGSNAYTEYATVNQYGIALPTRSAFRVYGSGTTNNLTTTQNGNGVLNSNNWTVDYSQGTGFSSSTGVFTAPVAGLYSTTLIARVSNTSSAQIAVVKNYASTNAVQAMWECGANCSTNHFGVSSITKLAAGDTLVIRVLLGQITFDGNDSWAVAYIG